MAKMYPSRLPDRVLNNRNLKGEVETFEALSKLPDEFEVFYNRCPNTGNAGRVYERKIDFIIIHEKLGLLAMEVKGGKIRIGHDGGFEQYHYTQNRWGSIDPFIQVKLALRELIYIIKSDSPKYWIPDNICVLFPGTYRHYLTNQPHSLPAGTLCADDVKILSTLVPTLFSKKRKATVWSRDTYIDVRRRLQNMPEAKGKGEQSSDQLEKEKRLFKSTRSAKMKMPKVEKVSRILSPIDEEEIEHHRAMGTIKVTAKKSAINYNPSDIYIPNTAKEAPRKTGLEWWEIISLVIAPTVTFFAILWLFPNSFVHRLF